MRSARGRPLAALLRLPPPRGPVGTRLRRIGWPECVSVKIPNSLVGKPTGSIRSIELSDGILGVEIRFVGDKGSALGATSSVVHHLETYDRSDLLEKALLRISKGRLGELIVDVVNANLGPSGAPVRFSARFHNVLGASNLLHRLVRRLVRDPRAASLGWSTTACGYISLCILQDAMLFNPYRCLHIDRGPIPCSTVVSSTAPNPTKYKTRLTSQGFWVYRL